MDQRDELDGLVRQRLARQQQDVETGGACLDTEVLASYADGSLSPSAKAEADAHLAMCAECRQVLGLLIESGEEQSVGGPHVVVGGPGAVREPSGVGGVTPGRPGDVNAVGRRRVMASPRIWLPLAASLVAAAGLWFLLEPRREGTGRIALEQEQTSARRESNAAGGDGFASAPASAMAERRAARTTAPPAAPASEATTTPGATTPEPSEARRLEGKPSTPDAKRALADADSTRAAAPKPDARRSDERGTERFDERAKERVAKQEERTQDKLSAGVAQGSTAFARAREESRANGQATTPPRQGPASQQASTSTPSSAPQLAADGQRSSGQKAITDRERQQSSSSGRTQDTLTASRDLRKTAAGSETDGGRDRAQTPSSTAGTQQTQTASGRTPQTQTAARALNEAAPDSQSTREQLLPSPTQAQQTQAKATQSQPTQPTQAPTFRTGQDQATQTPGSQAQATQAQAAQSQVAQSRAGQAQAGQSQSSQAAPAQTAQTGQTGTSQTQAPQRAANEPSSTSSTAAAGTADQPAKDTQARQKAAQPTQVADARTTTGTSKPDASAAGGRAGTIGGAVGELPAAKPATGSSASAGSTTSPAAPSSAKASAPASASEPAPAPAPPPPPPAAASAPAVASAAAGGASASSSGSSSGSSAPATAGTVASAPRSTAGGSSAAAPSSAPGAPASTATASGERGAADRGQPAPVISEAITIVTNTRMLVLQAPDGQRRWRLSTPTTIEGSQNAGRTWTVEYSDPQMHLDTGAVTAKGSCWIVGRRGLVLRWRAGRGWQRLTAPTTEDLVRLIAVDENGATVADRAGRAYVTTDGGLTWRIVSSTINIVPNTNATTPP
jgi:Putative zinc-finger